jgi:hypothetical protein
MHDETTETETAMERRLEDEARHLIGVLGDRETATDDARVEVSWYDDAGRMRAGHFKVYVTCDELAEDADDDAMMANHPATRAEELTLAELERRPEYGDASVTDVSAY